MSTVISRSVFTDPNENLVPAFSALASCPVELIFQMQNNKALVPMHHKEIDLDVLDVSFEYGLMLMNSGGDCGPLVEIKIPSMSLR
jgi:hypothetical protein